MSMGCMVCKSNPKLKHLKNPYQALHDRTGNDMLYYPESKKLDGNDAYTAEYRQIMDRAFMVKELWFNWEYLHFRLEGVSDTLASRKKHKQDPNYQALCKQQAIDMLKDSD